MAWKIPPHMFSNVSPMFYDKQPNVMISDNCLYGGQETCLLLLKSSSTSLLNEMWQSSWMANKFNAFLFLTALAEFLICTFQLSTNWDCHGLFSVHNKICLSHTFSVRLLFSETIPAFTVSNVSTAQKIHVKSSNFPTTKLFFFFLISEQNNWSE